MTARKAPQLVGVLLGNSVTAEESALIAERYGGCPYCVSYTSAGCTVIGVFSLPADHRWWLEWVAQNPEETLGLTRAEVFFGQTVKALSPWARGDVKPESGQAPCRAKCTECPRYRQECEGCPATRDYLGG